ncbi:hypothetical protein GCM10010420_36210 [Streptomyces glaucosporus]|uniref:DUF1540 domain-containing protein n=1 Tax=Streptomyces glaucosporus TaxID=284044 RepID=A0ABP5VJZ2_9ACTN
MEMPVVTECAVESCAYNRDGDCHALAITVGDPLHAHCDTYFTAPRKGGSPSAAGHVGACKMSDCRYNTDFECQASGISVGARQDSADCLTYSPR